MPRMIQGTTFITYSLTLHASIYKEIIVNLIVKVIRVNEPFLSY